MRRVAFARAKYGRPLLVDAGYISGYAAANFDQAGRPHALDFYDILLITTGAGVFSIDGTAHEVRAGVVFFTRPGEVRQWRAAGVDGACIFFTADFIAEAFSDPRFLDGLACFRPDRPSAALSLSSSARREYLRRFDAMRREMTALRGDSPHALRAVLYELLVLLDRGYVRKFGAAPAPARHTAVERFLAAVERDFRREHQVSAYAAALALSPGHLNALCREHVRRSAGACIRGRIVLEARRLLRYTDMTAAMIGYSLGFDDPSYFTRFFTRETGLSPRRYRSSA